MKQLLLLLIILILPRSVRADNVQVDGIHYEIDDSTKTAIVLHNQYSGNIVIPSVVSYGSNEYQVTYIGDNAFYGCTELTSITIPNSVTGFGVGAFSGCTSLTTVELDNNAIVSRSYYGSGYKIKDIFGDQVKEYIIGTNVTMIGEAAFSNCSMTTITIPNTIEVIGSEAFNGCKNLTSVYISDLSAWCKIRFNSNPLGFAQHLYLNGEEVNELTIPNDVTNISYNAFYGCYGITSVTIPNNVEDVSYGAFLGCVNLTRVELNCNSFLSTEFNSTTSLKNYFGNQVKEYIIGDSVWNIGNYAFYNCSELASITIGKNIKSIGKKAFGLCSNLTDFYSFSKIVPYTYNDTFTHIENTTLHVPATSLISYQNEPFWNIFKDVVKIVMPKHKLTYIIDDFEYKSYEIEEEEVIIPEPAPTKKGYTFSGWSEIPEMMPDHDVTITGTFTINKYKLIYEVDSVKYKTYEIKFGSTIIPEAEPTKEGYTFSGWNEIPEEMPAHDVIVTGSFIVNKYKLTYIVDGTEYKTYEIEYGATIIPETEPTKEGYTFFEWSEIPETMPAHDVIVTGSFIVNKYKLTYIVDGTEYKTYEIEYGATIIPETEPTKEGYTFFEWSEIPETMPAHDVIVTGSFIVNKYKLTYIVDGTEYKTYEIEYDATIMPETNPTKEGCTFSGWSEIPETMPAHNVTVTGAFFIATGIGHITSDENGNDMIFTVAGKCINKFQKGMNIIWMKNGTTRKIVIK